MMEPDYNSLDPEERTNKYLALLAVAFGVFSLCAGLIPIAGIVIAFLGLITGFFGMKSDYRKIAIAGIIISCFGLLTSLIYMILKPFNFQL